AATRNSIEEAVGDAYQNLAVLLLQSGENWEAARPLCERSVLYYPYQQRQAAAMLRKGSTPAAPGAESQAQGTKDKGGQDKGAQDKAKAETWKKVQAEAEAKAKNGDFDGALSVLDEAEKQLKGYAPYHVQKGLYNWQFATKTKAAGG